MIIRRDNLNAFAQAGQKDFAASVIRFLKQHYSEAAAASDAELSPPVERLIRRAQSYGLSTEQDMAIYVIAGFLLGEAFDVEFPAVQQVLSSPVLSAAEKSGWLTDWTEEIFKTLQR